jgi:hypothetical protein
MRVRTCINDRSIAVDYKSVQSEDGYRQILGGDPNPGNKNVRLTLIYQIVHALRTRYKSLTFKGTAALWLCNVEIIWKIEERGEMCRMVHEKFSKKQISSVP